MLEQFSNSIACEYTAENVRVNNGKASLEAVFAYPNAAKPSCAVVFAGPHPLLGGDMENNVVECVANELATMGFATLRFNYSGVGLSEGADFHSPDNLKTFWETSHTEDEIDRWQDLDSAVRFLRQGVGREAPLGVVAYSFGNYVTASWLSNKNTLETNGDPSWIFCIAPTVGKHDLQGLANSPAPKLIIAPEDDFATAIDAVNCAADKWAQPVNTIATERDGHFFRGHESWLSQRCYEFSCRSLQRGENQ